MRIKVCCKRCIFLFLPLHYLDFIMICFYCFRPQNCCVPKCNSVEGGHQFPKDERLKQQWIVAIHRIEKKNSAKLWQPSPHSVVCSRHFLKSDYKITSKCVLLSYYLFLYCMFNILAV